jgi:SP family sugar:H+ symporter-like MFS transporter
MLLPESPRYLLLKGRVEEARKSMGRLLTRSPDSPEVIDECNEVSEALQLEQAHGSGSYLDCFRNNEDRNGFRTWTGIMLQGWQQLTGINFICMFSILFFALNQKLIYGLIKSITELPSSSPQESRTRLSLRELFLSLIHPSAEGLLSSIIADVVNTAMTIVGIQLIDRVGRRRLLLIGAIGMCVCEFIVAIVRVPNCLS